MKRVKTLVIVSVLLLSSQVVTVMPSGIKAVTEYSNSSLYNLIIEKVVMSDYNTRCKTVGGEDVDILVVVRNQGDENITEAFSVKIFLNQNVYLDEQGVAETIVSGKSKRVHFYGIHINVEIGNHTLDAYINDKTETRNYCEFKATLTGVNTVNSAGTTINSNNSIIAVTAQSSAQPSVWIMHPRNNNLYLTWRAIYLHGYDVPFAIIIGSPIYRFSYGIWVTTNTEVIKVELYADGELVRTDYEPEDRWEETYSWQIRWCRLGYHEIKVIGYDNTGSMATDESSILVII